jgi:eukaryotic-like serine/threonine-protein kinase
VLVDLGIAAQFGGARGREELEAASKVMGTYPYMAPEQIRGELVDARADLYALGCILYEAITGAPPFSGSQGGSILYQHLHKQPEPPASRVATIPYELDRLVLQLLEKRPQDRLGYADDVAAILRSLGAEDPPREALPKPRPYLYRPSLAGRAGVLQRLDAAVVDLDRNHRGGRIFIGGESGVGKTRLAMEMSCSAAQRRLAVVTGQCIALGVTDAGSDASVKAAPLHPFRALLLAVADRCRELGEAETERILGSRGRVLAAYEPTLVELPGQAEQPDPPQLPAQATRARLLAYLRATILAFAEENPLLLILDDLQWADELSLSLLHELSANELREHALLLVGTYRMEEMSPDLGRIVRAPDAISLELDRLDTASVGAMVCGMLALRQPPQSFVQFLDHHSDGNPFFIAEYLQTAIGEGLLSRNQAGQWRIDNRSNSPDSLEAALPLPRTLAHLIERRLLGLGDQALALAQLASVLGREFDENLLMTTASLDEVAWMDAVETLRFRQILEETAAGQLRFVHDKLREITYEKIPEDDCQDLHRRAADAIEARYPAKPDFFPTLAHHFSKSRRHDKASLYFRRAGDRARAAYANSDAITFYRAVIEEEEARKLQIGSPSARMGSLDRMCENLGDVLVYAGRQEEARITYEGVLAQIPQGPAVRRARLHRKIGKTWETHHAHDQALRAYDIAEASLGKAPADEPSAAAEPSGDKEALSKLASATSPSDEAAAEWWHEWVQIQNDRIYVHYWLAQVDKMTALVAKVRPIVEKRGTPLQRAHFFDDLVHLNLRKERYIASAATVHYARAAKAASSESTDISKDSYAWFMLAFALLFYGDFIEAKEQMIGALREAERIADVPLQARCLTYLTMIHRRCGKIEETQASAVRSLSVANDSQMIDYIGAAEANLSWVAWCKGDLAIAERKGQTAITLWEQLSLAYPYPMQWMGRWVFVAIELRRDRMAAAFAHARAMLDPKQQRFQHELTAALEQGISAWERGEVDFARQHLTRATNAARELCYL